MQDSLVTRPARDTDADELICLIGGVYAEYPGCVLDVQREEPDLLAIASAYARRGGQFWVTQNEPEHTLVGCVGWVPGTAPERPGWLELRKLYVAKAYRRRGLASALVDRVEAAGRARGAAGVELWSDTRFRDAHRFYVARGYVQQPGSRELLDLSQSIELQFLLPLAGSLEKPRPFVVARVSTTARRRRTRGDFAERAIARRLRAHVTAAESPSGPRPTSAPTLETAAGCLPVAPRAPCPTPRYAPWATS